MHQRQQQWNWTLLGGALRARWPRARKLRVICLGARLALVLSLSLLAQSALAEETNTASFRVAFTRAMFTDVNENDARAAVKVWAQTIAQEHTVATDPEARILKDAPAVLQALQQETVDAVGMTVPEYAQVYTKVRLGPLFTTSNSGHYLEQYLLLVHRNSSATRLADLKGARLNCQQSARLCLTQQWLDLVLMQAGLKPAPEFFSKVNPESKVSKALLPVFFRQVEACVISRSGFDTMRELNPQLGQQLRVLLESPPVVPVVLAFRANYNPPFKPQLVADLKGLHETPTGAQVLTIFQSDRLEEQPEAFFEGTLELLARHGQKSAAPTTAAPGSNSLARVQARLGCR